MINNVNEIINLNIKDQNQLYIYNNKLLYIYKRLYLKMMILKDDKNKIIKYNVINKIYLYCKNNDIFGNVNDINNNIYKLLLYSIKYNCSKDILKIISFNEIDFNFNNLLNKKINENKFYNKFIKNKNSFIEIILNIYDEINIYLNKNITYISDNNNLLINYDKYLLYKKNNFSVNNNKDYNINLKDLNEFITYDNQNKLENIKYIKKISNEIIINNSIINNNNIELLNKWCNLNYINYKLLNKFFFFECIITSF